MKSTRIKIIEYSSLQINENGSNFNFLSCVFHIEIILAAIAAIIMRIPRVYFVILLLTIKLID